MVESVPLRLLSGSGTLPLYGSGDLQISRKGQPGVSGPYGSMHRGPRGQLRDIDAAQPGKKERRIDFREDAPDRRLCAADAGRTVSRKCGKIQQRTEGGADREILSANAGGVKDDGSGL